MKQSNGAVYIVLAALCWGLFPTFSRLCYNGGMSPSTVTALRAFITAAVYLIWGFVGGIFKGIKIKDIPFFVFYGAAAILSTYLFYAIAVKELTSAMAAILLYTAPAFVIIFSRIFYKTPITKIKLIALILTFSGSLLVVRAYDPSSVTANVKGIIIGLLAGIGYSMLTVIGKKGLEKYTPLANTFLPTIATALIMCLIVPPHTIVIAHTYLWLPILGVALFGGVLPYYLYLKGLSKGIDGGHASLLANVEPLMATICGVIFFSDKLEIWQLFGITIALFGAVLPQIKKPQVK